ncbi:Plasmid stabilization system protein [Symmachiella macrocystis]|uniref:Plasmid stabilization system protein n=1 Tax=Symmachiella macrocystis TaxID=2527985 RepID=A0A5C6BLC3_9PLAN|nr:type II toxin-antitoxin system RelE/ParE family toxin [Symmachiella macrocystis]TWU12805.1 Plasmid stabilization system protein [Symmachiella macrocystis]
MATFRISPEACSDLDQIWDYIGTENDNPSAADALMEKFEKQFILLAPHVHLGTARDDLACNLRMFPVQKYVVLYCPTESGIDVVQVVHSARDIQSVFRDFPNAP